jgi:hypothetical protein
MKRLIITEEEAKNILLKHKELILKEQSPNYTGDEKILRDAIASKCLRDGKLLKSKATGKIIYRAKTKSGLEVEFYPDYTYKMLISGKIGNWKCDTRKAEIDSQKIKAELEDFKKTGEGGGWMEKEEAIKSKTISWQNEDTYDTTVFKGTSLYRAKQRAGQTPLTKDQLAYVAKYLKAGWILPSDPKLTGPDRDNYEEVIVPGSKQAFGGEGIKMFQPLEDIKLRSDEILNKATEANASRSYSKKDCKDFLDTYWKSWDINRANPKARPDERIKIATQACVTQHYKRWGALAGGKWDEIIEALVGMGSGSYDGRTGPFAKSVWRLLPADYQ